MNSEEAKVRAAEVMERAVKACVDKLDSLGVAFQKRGVSGYQVTLDLNFGGFSLSDYCITFKGEYRYRYQTGAIRISTTSPRPGSRWGQKTITRNGEKKGILNVAPVLAWIDDVATTQKHKAAYTAAAESRRREEDRRSNELAALTTSELGIVPLGVAANRYEDGSYTLHVDAQAGSFTLAEMKAILAIIRTRELSKEAAKD